MAWEKKEIENFGLIKYDILGLKTLTVISDTLKMIEINTGQKISLPTELEDPKVYDTVFKTGNTSAIFQFDTSGLSKLSKQLGINTFQLLYDASALYRPGCVGFETDIITFPKGVPNYVSIGNFNRCMRRPKILSYDFNNDIPCVRKGEVVLSGNKDVYRAETEDGGFIYASGEHLFCIKKGEKKIFVPLNKLRIGDRTVKIFAEEGKDFVECKICNMKLKNIGRRHLRVIHRISKEKYLDLFPGSKIVSEKEMLKLKNILSKMGKKGFLAQQKTFPISELQKVGFKASQTPEVREKLRQINLANRDELSKRRIKFLKNNPNKHPCVLMAKKGNVSYMQKNLFDIIRKEYPKAVLDYPVRGTLYSIDVALVDKKIGLEYDGKFWHGTEECKKKDRIRDDKLSKMGWNILRFQKENYKDCIKEIKRVLV